MFIVAGFFLYSDIFFDTQTLSQIGAQSVFDAAATSGMANVSVTISASPPGISILQPVNKTYESNTSIILEIEVTNATSAVDRLFYNVDNGANTTLTLTGGANRTSFVTSLGAHTVYAFVNETSTGIVNSTSISFSVNASIRFQVIATKFDGASTNLAALNETQLQSISNLILENVSSGRISFIDAINLTADNITDDPINLNKYINISSFIFINDTIFTNLVGKRATLAFYNATASFANPRILRNGAVCLTTICIVNWTAGQTFFVNVTNFSRYGLEETPATATTAATTADEGTTQKIPRRGNNVKEEGDKISEEPDQEIPEIPQHEIPFSERFAELTPKLVLNKKIIIILTMLVVLLILLEYIQYHLDRKRRNR